MPLKEIPSYLLNKLSEQYHQPAGRQYKESKELLYAIKIYLEAKIHEQMMVEESSTTLEEVFKALGKRQAYREILNSLPDTELPRGTYDGQQSE